MSRDKHDIYDSKPVRTLEERDDIFKPNSEFKFSFHERDGTYSQRIEGPFRFDFNKITQNRFEQLKNQYGKELNLVQNENSLSEIYMIGDKLLTRGEALECLVAYERQENKDGKINLLRK